jgi:glycosyltransferase involved in cell wall biosynthesis
MRILIVTQYFWPESFRINDMAIGLKEKGHEVTVLTGLPNYPEGKYFKGYSFFSKTNEEWNGISIIRSKLIPRGRNSAIQLAFNYISFVFFACWQVIWLPKKFDKILVFQLSPIFLAIPALLAKFRFSIPVYMIVQDLWPESLASTKKGNNSIMIKWVARISDFIYKRADFLILPFKSFQPILAARGIASSKMSYLPNSADPFYIPSSLNPTFEYLFTGETHLLIAGNLGEAQGLDLVISAAAQLKNKYPGLRWLLVGEGRIRQVLEQQSTEMGLTGVLSFPGRFPATDIPALIARADASLLTLKKDPLFEITVPNRLQTYMACGKPVLASIDGEAAQIIQQADCGLHAPAGDLVSFIGMIDSFMQSSPLQRTNWANNARSHYLANFERDYLLDSLHQKLSEALC